MSKIGEKPLIETLLSGLSEENLNDLKLALNQGKITNYKSGLDLYTNGTLGLAHLGDLNGIYLSHHLLTFNKNSQGLGFYSVDSNGKLNPVDEYVDINELRRLIDFYLSDEESGSGVKEIEVTNIKNMSDAQLNELKPGDLVIKKTGNQKHTYVVSYKENGQGICLTYADASVVETQSYDYTAGHWVYNSEDKTELGGSGLPEVTADDNGKVLEVLSGAWGKGGKKVNVIDAPASTTLTDAEKSKIIEGLFINGEFLGFKSPILTPATLYGNIYVGGLIAPKPSNNNLWIYYYQIDTTTNLISIGSTGLQIGKTNIQVLGNFLINYKQFPSYPSNTGTFTLKCVDGVLTWVQDV